MFVYNESMEQKLPKEKMLYEALAAKTSDKDFVIAFHDYFSFILHEGVELCAHLNDPVKEREAEKNRLEEVHADIIKSVKESVKNIETFLKKKKLEHDHIFKDRLQDIHSLLANTAYVIGGERLDSIHSELADIVRRMYELGFKKEAARYARLGKNARLNTDDIIALEKRAQFLTDKTNFEKKDARSLAGALFRLADLYTNISRAENATGGKIRIASVFEDLYQRNLETEYAQLMSGARAKGTYFKREKYISDAERFHQSIVFNNPEVGAKAAMQGDIFSLNGNDIYHYKIGKLKYALKGLEDPKYIKAFKNVIRYMPPSTQRIRIKEFESVIDKKNKIGQQYRTHIGKSSKSFAGFLRKNGVRNMHPVTREVVIGVTDEYITFNNSL